MKILEQVKEVRNTEDAKAFAKENKEALIVGAVTAIGAVVITGMRRKIKKLERSSGGVIITLITSTKTEESEENING